MEIAFLVRWSRTSSWLALAVALRINPLAAQTQELPDKRHIPGDGLELTPRTEAGAYLKYWSTGSPSGIGAHTVFLHNTSTNRTIMVTSWEVYDCYNIRGAVCRVHDKAISLKPQDTIRLIELFPAVVGKEFSYNYRFKAAWFDSTAASR